MYPRNIQELIDRLPVMPLDAGVPDARAAEMLDAAMLERLFGGAVIRHSTPARLCLAGLQLLSGHLEDCHAIAQSVETPDGSLWHAMLHRREGDYANSLYWYRRAGRHPIAPALLAEATAAAASSDDPLLRSLAGLPEWDPAAFVECCRNALAGACDEQACRKIQQAEWRLLFDWCYRKATEDDAYGDHR